MYKTSVIGFPRIGENRELKKIVENFLKKEITKNELLKESSNIRKKHLNILKENSIDYITINDFSLYDNFLDTICLLGAIPKRYNELELDELDTYFAMAKGYQKNDKDVKALAMKKWFNTNYHYLVPELDKNISFNLNLKKILSEYKEAKDLEITPKISIIGPYTFLKLSNIKEGDLEDYINDIKEIYIELIQNLNKLDISYIQIEEPILVTDLNNKDIINFENIYKEILNVKEKKILLQTYFGDIRDIYENIIKLDFDAIGLDLIDGEYNFELIEKYGINNKEIFAGIVNGKNIFINDYKKSIEIIDRLGIENLVLSSSCSLLHLPFTIKNETSLDEKYKILLSFAVEKLIELRELKNILEFEDFENHNKYNENQKKIKSKQNLTEFLNNEVKEKVKNLKEEDFYRKEKFDERIKLQKKYLNLPKLPTTTIGSFPQTLEVRKIRNKYRKNEITKNKYNEFIYSKIEEVIKLQENLEIDVLVHGEFERTDMVEYFGENFEGFLITKNGWVQSYGTRCVKPPVIFGDISRKDSFTVEYIKYAQELTNKYVKGMLTGPITIINWSFVREDLSIRDIAYQIALALQDEVLDLEKSGIKVIQIDEAALREKLPLRKENWKEYLDIAIKAFRLTNSKVKADTQIHTHMCYSEFKDIINEIKELDADVITIEAAKSDLSMIDILNENNYDKEVGPGVYDIHSPRIPSVEEFETVINELTKKIEIEKLWINPDCGLKTRGNKETIESLRNMVVATKNIRKNL
ncbi:methionine synthase (B12-independent) [Hypnocyclicus thermotrophus]|uniref:5-methyltetrahydropteroyltriglutamate--homocysteine S-methyltransferase n=1 Tax=Hypnocyclicus thermotrophus TaxID=1627895 RepID=A0AA46I5S2_9FUSO|nr:5-methyltetrahydropteroyltriglutamate--homocysteine S-methyltransferase [Hypnocyclicus thermotrophus]TDT71429.1 methionine synthase (B12-independent) [Hypnocyclicus thermotrophus]